MFSPAKLDRFKVRKEELEKLRASFYTEALPLLENLYIMTYWIVLKKKSAKKIIKQIFFETIEYCNVTKNQADWQSWIYRIWMREINEFYEKKENDILTNFEFIDYSEISSYDNFSSSLKESGIEHLLGKLPAVLRIPLIIKEITQFKYEKIAELIDVPDGVVATRIYRARKLLFLAGKNYNYSAERQNWLNKESTGKIFELRKSALLADDELTSEEESQLLNSVNHNHQLGIEIKLQKEIKDQIQRSISENFSLNRLKSKIEKKAVNKFGHH